MKKTGLLIIDVQNGLFEKKIKIFKEKQFLDNINQLIEKARLQNWLVIFAQHNNNQLVSGTQEWQIHEEINVNENDFVVQKSKSSVFSEPSFINLLIEKEISHLIITGLVSHGCVKNACLDGVHLGFNIVLAADGHSNWNKNAADLCVQINEELEKNGIKIMTTREIVENFL